MSLNDLKIYVDLKNWNKLEAVIKHYDVLYDTYKSKRPNISVVEFYSVNDYKLVTTKLNKYNIQYKEEDA